MTNVAIQKNSTNYDSRADGAKWSLFQLGCYLETIYGREQIDIMFLRIEQLIIRSLQAVANDMIKSLCMFEIYGFDVMLDSSLKPWLIEINASPSLSADTREDSIVKRRMLHDAISILGVDVPKPSLTAFDLDAGISVIVAGCRSSHRSVILHALRRNWRPDMCPQTGFTRVRQRTSLGMMVSSL